MHEIRATVPADCEAETVRLARQVGIERIAVSDIFVYGPDERRRQVSVETSTPKARAFVDAVLGSPRLAAGDCTLTSRELRAVVDGGSIRVLTEPLSEPFPDVVQDLWQLSHVTLSYAARAFAGAILMATGITENNAVAIVVAALFLPFLAQVLAVSVGIWSRDRRLVRQGLTALAASTLAAVAGGALVGWLEGGGIAFSGFKSPLANVALSAVIGVTAGWSTADDTGRRYLIGVAAAVQLAILPVWFGTAVMLGLPPASVVFIRCLTFVLNLVVIAASALVAYALLHLAKRWPVPRAARSS